MLLTPVANHSVTVDFDAGAQPTHEGHPPVASYVVVNRLMVAEHQRAERADTFAIHATFLVTADRVLFVQLRQTHHDTPVHVALKFRVGLTGFRSSFTNTRATYLANTGGRSALHSCATGMGVFS